MNIKARLGEELRRTTLSSDSQTYAALFARLATLFNRPNIPQTHNVKYQDDEGDWVDMSSDDELQIALSLARQQGYALQLTLQEKSEKEKNEPSPVQEPFNAFNHLAEHFKDIAQQWGPVVERLAAVAAENGINAESLAERLGSITIISEPEVAPKPVSQDKPVHNAWCDNCRSRIAGIRYKCLDCPDFDFCSECMVSARDSHAPHDFILIERPGKCPYAHEESKEESKTEEKPKEEAKTEEKPKEEVKPEEPVHWAVCDNCDERIRGIRHKCNQCKDYDLCSGCISHAPNIHRDHTFYPIEKPVPHWFKCVVPETAPVVVEPVVEESAPAVEEPVVEAPVPVEAPAPVVDEAPVVENNNVSMERLQAALSQLEEMGFNDRRRNVEILMKNNGDIVNTIVQLISEF